MISIATFRKHLVAFFLAHSSKEIFLINEKCWCTIAEMFKQIVIRIHNMQNFTMSLIRMADNFYSSMRK